MRREEDEAGEALRREAAIVLRVSVSGVIEFVSHILPEYAGLSLVGQSIYTFAPPDQHQAMREALESTIRTRQTSSYETFAQAPDGTRDWHLTSVVPCVEGDELRGFSLTCINTSRWKAAEAELRESRAKLSLALAAGNVGLWRWDCVTDVVEWDDKLCAVFGVTRAAAPRTASAFVGLVPPDQRAAMSDHIQRAVEHGVYPDFELRVDVPEGTRWVIIKGGVTRDAAGTVVGLLGGVVDNTDRKRLEEHVQQTQKLEAVGHLSAGIAHNFNNMLAVIIPTLDLARAGRVKPSALEDALASARNAAALVRQLMVFSNGRPTTAGRHEPLSDTVRRTVDLCHKTFDRRIDIELQGLENVQDVSVDGADMEQVLVNLLLNARDALEHRVVGPWRIRVELRKLTTAEVRVRHPDARGRCAEIRISDTGLGMDDATRRRIFEPFFTTKPLGRGTGLGLSTAWATVRAHQGQIECVSVPDRGTTFTLVVPGAEFVDPQAVPRPDAAPEAREGQTALVIDDEPFVRNSLASMLEQLGFAVHCAASGEEGAQIAARTRVDVVLLDYSMPGQRAEETLRQLRALQPAAPVVCCSGLGVDLAGSSARLAKPFGLDALSDVLSTVVPRRG